MSTIGIENAFYIFRLCFSKEVVSTVKSIDDDFGVMWKRLDEKYGDFVKVVDVIMNGIQNTRNIKDGENRRFIEFINIIEDSYRDLKRLGLEKEIITTSFVSIIEKKLLIDLKREWSKLVICESSIIDKTDKFSSFLRFFFD